MDYQIHMSEALEILNDLMKKIDDLFRHQYVLFKHSWHLTIADLNITWVIQNLDNTVVKYARQ